MNDPRYSSGTCIDRTTKECYIDAIDSLTDTTMSDELFIALKKLSITNLKELRDVITKSNQPSTQDISTIIGLVKAGREMLDLIGNLMKAVNWGNTFDLDIKALNEAPIHMARAIKEAERTKTCMHSSVPPKT